jgi:Stress responsive A/B Barrel Domain
MNATQKFLHNVFFTLHDPSPAKQQKLVDDCYRYLAETPGVLSFAAGARNTASTRDVNDTEYHVALSILFDSPASHDTYQAWDRHKEFIAVNNENWRQVRVFDANVR